jgi:hypothetical protein
LASLIAADKRKVAAGDDGVLHRRRSKTPAPGRCGCSLALDRRIVGWPSTNVATGSLPVRADEVVLTVVFEFALLDVYKIL